jgi:hypothetical protein
MSQVMFPIVNVTQDIPEMPLWHVEELQHLRSQLSELTPAIHLLVVPMLSALNGAERQHVSVSLNILATHMWPVDPNALPTQNVLRTKHVEI